MMFELASPEKIGQYLTRHIFLCGYLVVKAVGLTFFQRGRIDTGCMVCCFPEVPLCKGF